MSDYKIYRCVTAVGIATLVAGGIDSVAYAQSLAMEEIVVTARKREENLQQVPLSITALTADMLDDAGVQDLRDLSYLTPGLTMLDFGAETFTAPNIRGLTQANTAGGENNVSIFIDGVYIFNFNAVNVSLLDLERIEVVKGPVSALYGRNSFAGAINYVTKKPGDEFEGKAIATIGTDDRYALNAAVGGPIVEGKLSARLAVGYDNFGGTWEDQVNGRDLGGYEKTGAQLSFVATPSETVQFGGAIYYADDSFDPPVRPNLAPNCAQLGANFREFCGRSPDGEDLLPEAPVDAGIGETGNDREFIHVNLNTSIDFGAATLDVLGGYNDIDFTRFSSFDNFRDGLAYNLVPGPGTVNLNSYFGQRQQDEDYSLEARLSSRQDQDFRWTFGGFLYALDRDVTTTLSLLGPIPTGQSIGGFASLFIQPGGRSGLFLAETDQISGFLGLEYGISDKLTVSGELRYTDEDKSLDTQVDLVSQADNDGAGLEGTWDFWDTRLTVDYQATDDALLYASVAKGSKSGGFNAGSNTPEDIQYDPEKNWTYEVGAKTIWADGRFLFNVAAFYIDWTDLQIVGIPDDTNNPGTVLKNFGEADTKGFEVDFSTRLAEGVAWGGGVAYSDPKFGNNAFDSTSRFNCSLIPSCAPNIVTVEGRELVNLKGFSLHRQSDWQFNTNIELDGELTSDWGWFARGDYSYESSQFAKVNNLASFGDRHILNLRVGAETEQVSVTAWVENLLDDTTPTINGTSTLLNTFATANQPLLPKRRTWGLTVSANF